MKRFTLAYIGLALLLAGAMISPARGAGPTLTIAPDHGTSGTLVQATGLHYKAGTTGRVKFGTVYTVRFRANKAGSFTVRFRTPQLIPQRYWVTAGKARVVFVLERGAPVPPPIVPPGPPPVGGGLPWSSWQWQLTGALQLGLGVSVYDVDLEATSAAQVAAMHAEGAQAICYISAGSWEDWRSDAGSFPAIVKGKGNGWPGEKWLDVRNWAVLGPIMTARMQRCLDKGFDQVEPDNIDGYTNNTGFPLTGADQIAYNRNLATAAHALGLGIGLKNDVEQIATLQPSFDWALNEECFSFNECAGYSAFSNAGKPVLITQYDKCPSGYDPRWLVILKDLNLGAGRTVCTP